MVNSNDITTQDTYAKTLPIASAKPLIPIGTCMTKIVRQLELR